MIASRHVAVCRDDCRLFRFLVFTYETSLRVFVVCVVLLAGTAQGVTPSAEPARARPVVDFF